MIHSYRDIDSMLDPPRGVRPFMPAFASAFNAPLNGIFAGGATAPVTFIPTDIAGCPFWYDVPYLSLVNGSGIASCTDRSGLAHHAIQVDTAKQPTYVAGVQNGLAVARFDGSNDFLQALFTLSQPVHLFIVVIVRNPGDAMRLIDGGAAKMSIYRSSGKWAIEAAGANTTSFTETNNVAYIVKAQFNGASTAFATNGSAYINYASTGTTTPGGVTLGAYINGGFNGQYDVGEVVGYDNIISSGDEALLLAYLNNRWAVY